jgi:hypothetical protein
VTYTEEVLEYVRKYLSEINLEEQDIEQYKSVPWHKIVSLYWTALAYYKANNFYFDLSEIKQPQVGVTYAIRLKDQVINYRYDGEWIETGSLSEDLYK